MVIPAKLFKGFKIQTICILLSLMILGQGLMVSSKSASKCRFAKQFSIKDMDNDLRRDQFITKLIEWETHFMKDVGWDNRTGLTFDGYRLDFTTGLLLKGGLHYWTASSKESIQMGLLAKVLEGDKYANQIYTVNEVFSIIDLKVNTFEKFAATYPGFGGYFPWVYLNGTVPVPTWDFKDRVPALDNGQMFWAALSVAQIWSEKYPDTLPQLRQRWNMATWKPMIKNSRKMFFNETTKKIRAVANIRNISQTVQQNEYTNDDNYYLDDPYEGELYAWLITLFAKDQYTKQEIDFIWKDKRNKLKAVEYPVHSMNNTPITVQKGWWFSAHEQWKNLFMPYYLSPTYSKIQHNNEKARTWHSVDTVVNGMYASVTGPASNNSQNMDYYSDCGIQTISFNKVHHTQIVTPYSTFPLLLVNREVGLKWLHNMLLSPCGQTVFGALEGTSIDGTQISPVLTWDTKITTVLALLNGTTTIVKRFLEQNNYLGEFVQRLEAQYALEFKQIKGTNLQFGIPRVTVKKGRPDFTTCA